MISNLKLPLQTTHPSLEPPPESLVVAKIGERDPGGEEGEEGPPPLSKFSGRPALFLTKVQRQKSWSHNGEKNWPKPHRRIRSLPLGSTAKVDNNRF